MEVNILNRKIILQDLNILLNLLNHNLNLLILYLLNNINHKLLAK